MPLSLLKTAITHGRSLKYMPIGKYVCSVLLLSLITFPCLSQTIGYWTFNSTLAGAGSGAHNTLSTADFNSGIPTKSFNGGLEYVGQDGWPAGGINTGTYLQFSISPSTGYQLDLTSILLRVRRSNTGTPSGAGPTSWSLRSSIDGYASDITSNSLTHNYSNFSVALGSAFLNVYSTVTFRLYGYSVTINGGGTSKLVVDSINIQGIGEVLPVSITGVQALHNDDKNVSVKWQVTNVHEGSVFNVERSTNGSDFTTINRFREQETKSTGSYSYEDNQAPGNAQAIYYRIKINEPTGWTYFSWLVKVDNKTTRQLLIDYTTINGQSLVTSLQVPEKGRYIVSVLAMNGAVLQQRALELEAGVHVLAFPLDALAHGTYVVRLSNNKAFSSKKFVW
jgi:hypothetical protein